MKFIENGFMLIGITLVFSSAWEIIQRGEYTGFDLFILGFISIVLGQSFKAISDSKARDKFLKKD